MEQRMIPRLGRTVSVVGLGTWQLGADWGEVDRRGARRGPRGRRRRTASRSSTPPTSMATAAASSFCGSCTAPSRGVRGDEDGPPRRRRCPRTTTRDELPGVERPLAGEPRRRPLDLVQLHCPPDGGLRDDAVFEALDEMVDAGRIRAYGVSVETCAASAGGDRPAARRDRADHPQLLPAQAARGGAAGRARGGRRDHRPRPARVGSAVGALRRAHDLRGDDHRSYNRHGEAFDVGETFAGVPFEVGVAAARELQQLVDPGIALAQFALRWVIDQPGVNTVIPGARNADQVAQNAAAAALDAAAPRAARRRARRIRPADPRARSRPLVGRLQPPVVSPSRSCDQVQPREQHQRQRRARGDVPRPRTHHAQQRVVDRLAARYM